MTSTKVTKTLTEDGKIIYKYLFEVLSNTVEKHGIFPDVSVEQVHKVSESLFINSLLAVLRTFVGQTKVIIGLGPGRCGTMSLSIILAAQKDVMAHHESEPGLDWDSSIYEFIGKWASLFYFVAPILPFVADIANWYLPFVPYILEVNPKAKFVCIRRDIEEVVASFMLKVSTTSHWTDIGSEHWHASWERGHHYRKRFPKYDLPKEEGCRRYVTEYYKQCEEYAKDLPDNFRIFDIEVLNSEDGIKSILEFCGIKREECSIDEIVETHINKTTDHHRKIVRRFKDEYGEEF
jgi:hypothetical protein